MKWLLGLVVAAVLASSACTRGGLQSGEGRLVFDDARVSLSRDGGPYRVVEDDVTVSDGDRVRLTSGEATLRLPDKARILLHGGSNLRLAPQPVLLRGEVIALPGSKPLTVRALESSVVARSGAIRIRSGLGVTAGVYQGLAQLRTAGQTLDVPAYRQASISTYGLLPDRPMPLSYKEKGDRWDLRYLSAAIELSDDLQTRSDGFSNQLREGQGRTLGFYRLLFPQLEKEQGAATCLGDLTRPQGETLVGTSIALESDRGSFDQRCAAAFAFREEGATWGLVALDQRVTSVMSIRELLADALGRLPSSSTFAAPPPGAPIEVAAPVDASPAPPAGEAARGDDVGATPPDSRPAGEEQPGGGGLVPGAPTVPGLPPAAPPPDEPQQGLLEPLLDPVENVVGQLLGGLLG